MGRYTYRQILLLFDEEQSWQREQRRLRIIDVNAAGADVKHTTQLLKSLE